MCRARGVYGAFLFLVYMAGVTDGFWFSDPMFHTVEKLMVVVVVGHLAAQIHSW